MQKIEDQEHKLFGIIAESEGYDNKMILLDFPFGRLMDEIIVPYDTEKSFFIDGVPTTKAKIKRIKIVELGVSYQHAMGELKRGMTLGSDSIKKTYGEQYATRFEHILRTNTVDVTSQVIKAYNQAIKPSLKDYLPKRKELIDGATTIFIEGMKLLS